MARTLSASMTKLIRHKVLSSLVNEAETADYYRQMFEEAEWIPAERSLHTAIPPANVRIQNFSRKSFRDYDKIVDEVKARDAKMFEEKLSRPDEVSKGLYLANIGSIYDQP